MHFCPLQGAKLHKICELRKRITLFLGIIINKHTFLLWIYCKKNTFFLGIKND